MTGEAKHRKLQDNCESEPSAEKYNVVGKDSNKSYRTACHAGRICFTRMLRCFATRRQDITAMAGLWFSWIFGYMYSTTELLKPMDMFIVRCVSVVAHVIFLLAIFSWMAVIFHGPGRVPVHQGNGSQLSRPMAACLDIGKCLESKAFCSEDGWCQKCARWKPPLANHCSICGKCSLWMDHHCNFAGQCIGFRNLRSFLLMQLYTQLLIIVHMPLAVRRLWLEPVPFFDWVAGIKLFLFLFIGYHLRRLVRYFLSSVLGKISRGWPSYVLMCKFGCLMEYAQGVQLEAYVRAQRLSQEGPHVLSPALERLKSLQERVLIPGRFGGANLRGIFASHHFWHSVGLVFGEPLSWRWLNPIKAGGTGDPLAPSDLDVDACLAWAELQPILQELRMVAEVEMEQIVASEMVKKQTEMAEEQAKVQAEQAVQDRIKWLSDHAAHGHEHTAETMESPNDHCKDVIEQV